MLPILTIEFVADRYSLTCRETSDHSQIPSSTPVGALLTADGYNGASKFQVGQLQLGMNEPAPMDGLTRKELVISILLPPSVFQDVAHLLSRAGVCRIHYPV